MKASLKCMRWARKKKSDFVCGLYLLNFDWKVMHLVYFCSIDEWRKANNLVCTFCIWLLLNWAWKQSLLVSFALCRNENAYDNIFFLHFCLYDKRKNSEARWTLWQHDHESWGCCFQSILGSARSGYREAPILLPLPDLRAWRPVQATWRLLQQPGVQTAGLSQHRPA